jgi:SAM-dependent methyltransferase
MASASIMLSRLNEISPFASAQGIFDIGCGTGAITKSVLNEYGKEIPSDARLVAGDFSDGMLELVREKRGEALNGSDDDEVKEAWRRLQIINIDAHDLGSSGLEDGVFSHVIGSMVYFLLPEPPRALRETYRVLCDGGVVASMNGMKVEHIDAINEAVEVIRPGTNLQLLKGVWTSEDGVKGELERAGFVNVEVKVSESRIEYESHRGFAEMLLKMPVMDNLYRDWKQDERARLTVVLAEKLKDKNPEEPGSLKGKNIAAFGRKKAAA